MNFDHKLNVIIKHPLLFLWLIFVIILVIKTLKDCSVEGFYTYHGYYKKYCSSCGWRSRSSCSKCTNCGYCITPDGTGECVPGDSSGPYFREDCLYWEYGDPYYYYPYNHIYPVVKVKTTYPYSRYNMRGRNKLRKYYIE